MKNVIMEKEKKGEGKYKCNAKLNMDKIILTFIESNEKCDIICTKLNGITYMGHKVGWGGGNFIIYKMYTPGARCRRG